jgi:hypothetical protein
MVHACQQLHAALETHGFQQYWQAVLRQGRATGGPLLTWVLGGVAGQQQLLLLPLLLLQL